MAVFNRPKVNKEKTLVPSSYDVDISYLASVEIKSLSMRNKGDSKAPRPPWIQTQLDQGYKPYSFFVEYHRTTPIMGHEYHRTTPIMGHVSRTTTPHSTLPHMHVVSENRDVFENTQPDQTEGFSSTNVMGLEESTLNKVGGGVGDYNPNSDTEPFILYRTGNLHSINTDYKKQSVDFSNSMHELVTTESILVEKLISTRETFVSGVNDEDIDHNQNFTVSNSVHGDRSTANGEYVVVQENITTENRNTPEEDTSCVVTEHSLNTGLHTAQDTGYHAQPDRELTSNSNIISTANGQISQNTQSDIALDDSTIQTVTDPQGNHQLNDFTWHTGDTRTNTKPYDTETIHSTSGSTISSDLSITHSLTGAIDNDVDETQTYTQISTEIDQQTTTQSSMYTTDTLTTQPTQTDIHLHNSYRTDLNGSSKDILQLNHTESNSNHIPHTTMSSSSPHSTLIWDSKQPDDTQSSYQNRTIPTDRTIPITDTVTSSQHEDLMIRESNKSKDILYKQTTNSTQSVYPTSRVTQPTRTLPARPSTKRKAKKLKTPGTRRPITSPSSPRTLSMGYGRYPWHTLATPTPPSIGYHLSVGPIQQHVYPKNSTLQLDGLTSGQVTGVAIGCIVGFWIILGPLVCLICRMRDKAKEKRQQRDQDDSFCHVLIEEMIRTELANGRAKMYRTSVTDEREIERLPLKAEVCNNEPGDKCLINPQKYVIGNHSMEYTKLVNASPTMDRDSHITSTYVINQSHTDTSNFYSKDTNV